MLSRLNCDSLKEEEGVVLLGGRIVEVVGYFLIFLEGWFCCLFCQLVEFFG